MNGVKILLLLFAMAISTIVGGQGHAELKFNKDKKFKIAQFTDIHWNDTSVNCAATVKTIEMVLETEKPDLVVFTGDIVTHDPGREGWLNVTAPVVKYGIPWAVTLGNHENDPDITREEIFDILEGLPNFVGEKGADLTGCGNYALQIKSSDNDKNAATIYCFDSNTYSKNKNISDYDWVHYDQIGWYMETSRGMTEENKHRPLPALAFLHIPVPEYAYTEGNETMHGIKEEGIASPDVNSGLFVAMLEMRDVMGMFVGHDHNNNFIYIHKDIALAFGQVTGEDAYGHLPRGSRIVELKEGFFSFDTWIRTEKGISYPYNYPSGLSLDDEDVVYQPATKVDGLKNGVNYKYYEGKFSSVKDISSAKCIEKGTIQNFSIEGARQKDHFAFEYEAYLKIDKKGTYRFYTYSDDGSQLFINDALVVDNDGSHSAGRMNGKIALEAGYHKIKVLYFEDYMGDELEVGMAGVSMMESRIPDQMLFVKE
jgi:hypothetical protein